MKKLINIIYNRLYKRLYKVSVKNVLQTEYDIQKIREEGYFSQCGQDKFVIENLLDLCNGVFVDIGATDGIEISNTYYMEKNLGWTGIAIEPRWKAYEALKNNRTCITLNCCISNFNGTARFMEIEGFSEMLSGLVSKYDPRHLDRIKTEYEKFGGSTKYIDVPCFTLKSIIEKYQIKKIHYLTIDTEGGELEILETLKDVQNIPIQVISVENNYGDRRIQKLLKKYDYKLVTILGTDEIYQKQLLS